MHHDGAAQWTAQRRLNDNRARRVWCVEQRQLCPTYWDILLLRLLGFVHIAWFLSD